MNIELERFEAIINRISDEIVIIDKDFKITSVNPEFCNNYDIKKVNVLDSYCHKTIHDLDDQCTFDNNTCPLIHVKETKMSYKCLHKHFIMGKEILIEQFTTPFDIQNGEIQSVCKIGKKFREYAIKDINILDDNISLKQKMSEFCQDIQNYVELIMYFLKQNRNEGDIEILLREILEITKFGKELLSLPN